MKIFRYSNFPTNESPGSGLAAYNLSKHSDITSYILCKEISEKCRDELINSNIRISALSANSFIYKIIKKNIFLRSILVMLHGLAFVRKSSLIHIHNIDGIFLLVIAFVFRKKIIYTFHGTDFIRVSNNKILRKFFSKIDVLLFVSKTNFMKQKIFSKISVCM